MSCSKLLTTFLFLSYFLFDAHLKASTTSEIERMKNDYSTGVLPTFDPGVDRYFFGHCATGHKVEDKSFSVLMARWVADSSGATTLRLYTFDDVELHPLTAPSTQQKDLQTIKEKVEAKSPHLSGAEIFDQNPNALMSTCDNCGVHDCTFSVVRNEREGKYTTAWDFTQDRGPGVICEYFDAGEFSIP
jgi:hypothetical protein